MSEFSDIRGLALTAANQSAVDAYDETIVQLCEYRASAMKQLKVALQHDAEMPMALCLQGYLFLLIATNAVYDRVQNALQQLEKQTPRLNAREALHCRALRAWFVGDDELARRLWREILTHAPLDLLAMKMLHSAAFWSGDVDQLLDSAAGVFPQWHEDTPGFAFVAGMLAFGLEEFGDFARAEKLARQAIEINADDLWALHALAHVFEMQGRVAEGRALLQKPRDVWDDRNPFKGHLWWHAALFCIRAREYDEALAIYDASICVADSVFYLDVQNTASLLARLQMLGVNVGARWEALADIAEQQCDDHVLAFTEMHYAMSLAAAGRARAAKRHLDSLKQFANKHKPPKREHWAAGVAARVGADLCAALAVFYRGDYAAFVDAMLPVRYRLRQIGGSFAQRDVFEQMLQYAAGQCGREALAMQVAAERAARTVLEN